MSIVKFAQELRTLLSDRDKWTKGSLARNSVGDWCLSNDEDAQCWCLLGALLKTGDLYGKVYQRVCFLFIIARCGKDGPITSWNDRATHDKLMSMLNDLVKFAETHEAEDPEEVLKTLESA